MLTWAILQNTKPKKFSCHWVNKSRNHRKGSRNKNRMRYTNTALIISVKKNFITFIKLIFKWHARMEQKRFKSFWRYKSPLLLAVNQKNTLSQLSFHILIFNSCEDILIWFPFFYTSSSMVFNSLLDYFYFVQV